MVYSCIVGKIKVKQIVVFPVSYFYCNMRFAGQDRLISSEANQNVVCFKTSFGKMERMNHEWIGRVNCVFFLNPRSKGVSVKNYTIFQFTVLTIQDMHVETIIFCFWLSFVPNSENKCASVLPNGKKISENGIKRLFQLELLKCTVKQRFWQEDDMDVAPHSFLALFYLRHLNE